MTSTSRRRRWWRLALFAVVAAVVGGSAAWMYRAELAARVAIGILEQQGFGPVELSVRYVGLHSAYAENVGLYGGTVRASGLTITFLPGDLYAGRVETLEIEGLNTSIAVQGKDILVGGRPLPAPTAGPASPGMPVAAVTLRNAEITATLPGLAVPVRVTGGGRLAGTILSFDVVATMIADRGSVLEVLAVGKHDIADSSGTASASMRTLKFHKNSKQPQDLFPALAGLLPPIDGEARAVGIVSWKGMTIVPDIVAHLDDVAFQTDFATVSDLSADIHVTGIAPLAIQVSLRDAVTMVKVASLSEAASLAGKGRLEDRQFTFDIVASMKADKGSVLEILTAGMHDLSSGTGKASVTMRTLKFHKHSKQPGDLIPALAGVLPPIDGAARAAGIVSWHGTTVVPDLLVRLDDISFVTAGATVSGLVADLNITQFAPLATAPHQVITASIKPGGLTESAFRLQFELQTKPAIRVEALSSELAGGKISVTPFTVDPTRPAIDTIVHLSAVELDRVFQLLNVEGLAGRGRIEGDVGLHMRNGRVTVDRSRLVASGPGELNITNSWLIEKIPGGNQTVRDAMQALGDFHYETLSIELDRAESGQGSIVLHLQGQNPTTSSLKGQKINFNIRLESNFDRLTELALQSVETAQKLLLLQR